MDLDISTRWHHPVHVFHDPNRPGSQKARGHSTRMSAELGIARAVSGVVATAWLGIAAHQLTVYQFGQVTLVLSLGSLVSIGTDLGIPLALSKVACDHDPLDHDAVWKAVVTRVIAGLVAGAVLIALWANAGQANRWWVAGLYAVSVTVTPVGSSFLAMLRDARDRHRRSRLQRRVEARAAGRRRPDAGRGVAALGRRRRLCPGRPRVGARVARRVDPTDRTRQDTRSAAARRAASAGHVASERGRDPRHRVRADRHLAAGAAEGQHVGRGLRGRLQVLRHRAPAGDRDRVRGRRRRRRRPRPQRQAGRGASSGCAQR